MVRDLVGSASGPSDLASNKKRLHGYGQVRRPVAPREDPSRGSTVGREACTVTG